MQRQRSQTNFSSNFPTARARRWENRRLFWKRGG